jgi:hypothetical protein
MANAPDHLPVATVVAPEHDSSRRSPRCVSRGWLLVHGFPPLGYRQGCHTPAGNREAKHAHVRNGTVHQVLVYNGDDCVGRCQYGSPVELPNINNPKAYAKDLAEAPEWRIGSRSPRSRALQNSSDRRRGDHRTTETARRVVQTSVSSVRLVLLALGSSRGRSIEPVPVRLGWSHLRRRFDAEGVTADDS